MASPFGGSRPDHGSRTPLSTPTPLFYTVPVAAGLVNYRAGASGGASAGSPAPDHGRCAVVAAFLVAETLYALHLVNPHHLVPMETEPLKSSCGL